MANSLRAIVGDEVFRALADPTRRAILRLLNAGEKSAGELASQFTISAPSMSHHFGVLKNAGLIRVRREGQQLFYCLDTTVMQDALTVLLDLLPPEATSKEN
ncbi:MAG: autorepressor SdpR family transcription factor [Fimbriimonas sp.]